MKEEVSLQMTMEKWKKDKIKSRTYELGHKKMADYVWSLVEKDMEEELAFAKIAKERDGKDNEGSL